VDEGRVLLVHRPRYDDWTFPKGKAQEGESDESCALREVLEETGFDCRLGDELLSTFYRDSRGREKRVRYWVMEIARGEFHPSAEVDEIRWCTIAEAARLLSHPRDRRVLADAL
jgi:8-oxo-dGTP pyrophosphatase MutT (NUDIX family)